MDVKLRTTIGDRPETPTQSRSARSSLETKSFSQNCYDSHAANKSNFFSRNELQKSDHCSGFLDIIIKVVVEATDDFMSDQVFDPNVVKLSFRFLSKSFLKELRSE